MRWALASLLLRLCVPAPRPRPPVALAVGDRPARLHARLRGLARRLQYGPAARGSTANGRGCHRPTDRRHVARGHRGRGRGGEAGEGGGGGRWGEVGDGGGRGARGGRHAKSISRRGQRIDTCALWRGRGRCRQETGHVGSKGLEWITHCTMGETDNGSNQMVWVYGNDPPARLLRGYYSCVVTGRWARLPAHAPLCTPFL